MLTYRLVILWCLLVLLITLTLRRFMVLSSQACSEGCGLCCYPYLAVASREAFCDGEIYLMRSQNPLKPNPEMKPDLFASLWNGSLQLPPVAWVLKAVRLNIFKPCTEMFCVEDNCLLHQDMQDRRHGGNANVRYLFNKHSEKYGFTMDPGF